MELIIALLIFVFGGAALANRQNDNYREREVKIWQSEHPAPVQIWGEQTTLPGYETHEDYIRSLCDYPNYHGGDTRWTNPEAFLLHEVEALKPEAERWQEAQDAEREWARQDAEEACALVNAAREWAAQETQEWHPVTR